MILLLSAALVLQGPSAGFVVGPELRFGGFGSSVRSVAFSPDESQIYGASDSEIIAFDVASGKEIGRVEVSGPSAVTERFALRGGIDSAGVLDLPALTSKRLHALQDHSFPKSDVLGLSAVSGDGEHVLLSGVADQSVAISGSKGAPISHKNFATTSAAVSDGGEAAALGSLAGELRIYNADSKQVFSVDAKGGAIVSLAFGEDGKALAIGTGNGSVLVYRGPAWWVKASAACGGMVYSVVWDSESEVVAAASGKSEGGRVFLLDPASGRTLAKIDTPTGVHSLAFSPKGDRIALGCEDGVIRVRRLRR
ncbi:MAG: WD40 repeat domain-containing protein [Armatimonadota bacterium]|nr:WD40 repeat domain-containing protein [Armatimonadota bacterium]